MAQGLKDPRYQSKLGRLADRDVDLAHAQNWSRERMMTARQLADQIEALKQATAPKPSASEPRHELKQAPEPSYTDELGALKYNLDPRLGLAQMVALPALAYDLGEGVVDAMRGTSSPSRFRQYANDVSKVLGGSPMPNTTAHWRGELAGNLINPANFLQGPLTRMVASIPAAISHGADEFVRNIPLGVGVIKNKGGNWLNGSVEGALGGLKPLHAPYGNRFSQDQIDFLAANPKAASLNNWIDKQLTRYVKNDMATPEDPIRALAERGVLHFDPNEVAQARRTVHPSGEVPRVMGESPLARAWEQTSDSFIAPETAGRFKLTRGQDGTTTLSRNPWLEKLPNDAIVHDVYESSRPSQLGFSHLTDELANALNPESGLPRHLLLDPKSMDRVSVPQAVERVSQINAWRAAQKAEADMLRANNAATVLHKEYPDKGFKWVELRKGELPEGWVQEGLAYVNPADPKAKWIYPEEALRDALKYEGDTMGHCVGGYCEDVASGRSKIYSLRDAKGQPHVTIEVAPPQGFAGKKSRKEYEAFLRGHETPHSEEEIAQALQDLDKGGAWSPRIQQIKGKQNRAPNDEYLPFVQDFVKSGKWSDVGDLQNAGLTKHPTGKYISDAEANALAVRHFGDVNMGNAPDSIENPWQYANRIRRYDPEMLSDTDKAFLADWDAGNFAHGGSVKNNLSVQQLQRFIAKHMRGRR